MRVEGNVKANRNGRLDVTQNLCLFFSPVRFSQVVIRYLGVSISVGH